MKFMISWHIKPGHHKPAAEGFLKSGAPAPAGAKLLGRWHGPASSRGWALCETDDLKALGTHTAEWANLLDLEVTPVIEDPEAAEVLAKVYGK